MADVQNSLEKNTRSSYRELGIRKKLNQAIRRREGSQAIHAIRSPRGGVKRIRLSGFQQASTRRGRYGDAGTGAAAEGLTGPMNVESPLKDPGDAQLGGVRLPENRLR